MPCQPIPETGRMWDPMAISSKLCQICDPLHTLSVLFGVSFFRQKVQRKPMGSSDCALYIRIVEATFLIYLISFIILFCSHFLLFAAFSIYSFCCSFIYIYIYNVYIYEVLLYKIGNQKTNKNFNQPICFKLWRGLQ